MNIGRLWRKLLILAGGMFGGAKGRCNNGSWCWVEDNNVGCWEDDDEQEVWNRFLLGRLDGAPSGWGNGRFIGDGGGWWWRWLFSMVFFPPEWFSIWYFGQKIFVDDISIKIVVFARSVKGSIIAKWYLIMYWFVFVFNYYR